MGKRSIEVIGLSGNLHLLVGAHAAESTHVVQAVREFYQQSTDIIMKRVEHLLIVVNLARLACRVLFLLFGDHINKERHIIAKTCGNILYGVRSILYHIVQKSRDYGVCTQTEFLGNNLGDCHRMHDIRFARLAALLLVSLTRQQVSVINSFNVFGRQASCQTGEQMLDLQVYFLTFHGLYSYYFHNLQK